MGKKILTKWKTFLDLLDVINPSKKLMLALYANHFMQIEENKENNMSSLFVTNMLILKSLNSFKITKNPDDVENVKFSISFDKEEIQAIENFTELDFYAMMDNVIVNGLIKKYKNEKLLIYTMVDSVQVISEKTSGGKIIVNSRIKIL